MSGVPTVEDGAVVVVHCTSPKERLWGLVVRLDALGLVLRGLDLASVEDWVRQEFGEGDPTIGPSTAFLPMHRIERIWLDETAGAAEGITDRVRQRYGAYVRERLRGTR